VIAQTTVNSGDTSWVMICAALVLFMTPGLAFFYAGMVRGRNTLVMLQQNFIPLGVVSLTWVFVGYTVAFGNDAGGGILGDLGTFALHDLGSAPAPSLHVVTPDIAIPTLAFVAYQLMFAVITPALATGAVADRMKFAGWAVFLAIWSIIVYAPVVHWLWAPAGWLTQRGAQDWAGGMVVHASAGAAALALLVVLGRRQVWPGRAPLPHSIPLVIIGAGILWFGWFGFNAGDGLRADGVAAQALLNTHVAAAAGMLIWLGLERVKDGHPTILGAVTGAVAGLATITPCAGYVSTSSAVVIGALAGVVCHLALRAKDLFRFDDALDVIAVHFIGGILGSLLLGFFGEEAINGIGADGIFFGGGAGLLGEQVLAIVVVVAFSFCITWLIAITIEKTIGLRVTPSDEDKLDQRQQGMEAYHLSRVAGLVGVPPGNGDARTVSAESVQGAGRDLRLVTGLLETGSVHTAELKRALLDAGASTIVVTEAQIYTKHTEEHVIRGDRREIDLPDRLRVEVIVPQGSVAAVLEALDRFSSGREGGFVQNVEPTLGVPT
jgi:Amt family ammonium transporter